MVVQILKNFQCSIDKSVKIELNCIVKAEKSLLTHVEIDLKEFEFWKNIYQYIRATAIHEEGKPVWTNPIFI